VPPPHARDASSSTLLGPLFSRSYEVILPSSLTEDHPFALEVVFLPTCVGLRYGRLCTSRWGFSWRVGRPHTRDGSLGLSLTFQTPLARGPRYEDAPPSTTEALLPARVPPSTQALHRRSRTINLVSIAYALRPRLRPD